MPSQIAQNNFVQVAVYTRGGSQVAINVYNFLCTAMAGQGGTDFDFAGIFDPLAAVQYKSYLCVAATYLGIRVRVLGHPPLPFISATANQGPGLSAGDLIPTQAAMIVSYKTALAGRSNRGRTFLPFWSEGANDATGRPLAGSQSAALVVINNIFKSYVIGTAPNTSTVQPVVFSRKDLTGQIVTTRTVRPDWGTIRRRSQANRGDIFGP